MSEPTVPAHQPPEAPPENLREGVIWAYRLLLGREPNDEAAIEFHLRAHKTGRSIRDAFLATPEFHHAVRGTPAGLSPESSAVVDRFRPFCETPGPEGFWNDFLGIRTRCTFLPDGYEALSGTVQAPPGSTNGPLHDKEEWIGTLRSVLEADGRLVAVELGAGWAPWLVASAKAAERIGIEDVRLIGIEGSSGHVTFMRQHLSDNGIDPGAHRLLHGVVGTSDGTARFPRLAQPNNVYGSQVAPASADDEDTEEVPSISLGTLLGEIDRVDILHCDIQGLEAEVFEASAPVVDRKVRRAVIGTHSRRVEAELMDTFSRLGWALESESVCKLLQGADNALHLLADGCQVWRNRKFDAVWDRARSREVP